MSIFRKTGNKGKTPKAVTMPPMASGKETGQADMRAHSEEIILIDGWPDDRLIPGEYSDWLAFCLYDHIFPTAHGLSVGEIMMVRFDLAAFRGKRTGRCFMIPICPELFYIEKFARGHNYFIRNREGMVIGLVFNGFAIGKGCLMEREEYNYFPTKGLAKPMKAEMDDAERLFGGSDRIKVWKSDNTCFLTIGDMK